MNKNIAYILILVLIVAPLVYFHYSDFETTTIKQDNVTVKFVPKWSYSPTEQTAFVQDKEYYANENVTIIEDFDYWGDRLKDKDITTAKIGIKYSNEDKPVENMDNKIHSIDIKEYTDDFEKVELTFKPKKEGYYGLYTYYLVSGDYSIKSTYGDTFYVNPERQQDDTQDSDTNYLFIGLIVVVAILVGLIIRGYIKKYILEKRKLYK